MEGSAWNTAFLREVSRGISLKNIVFDLGGVVLNWDPDAIIGRVFEDSEDRARIRSDIFSHQDWLDLDRGTIELGSALRRFASRTGISLGKVLHLVDLVPRSLTPMEETIQLIATLKALGYKIFCLSNMNRPTYGFLKRRYGFWDLFDGRVISSHIRMLKPEPEIYRHLLAKYELAPGETIFIDDTLVNVQTAATLGIEVIHFESPEQCRRQLETMLDSALSSAGLTRG